MTARPNVSSGASELARLRSALLGLSTRIAEARGEDEVCRSVVEGLRDDAFGFDDYAVRDRGWRYRHEPEV